MNLVIRQQSIHIRAANVLLVQVKHGNIRVVLKDHTGDHFIPNL